MVVFMVDCIENNETLTKQGQSLEVFLDEFAHLYLDDGRCGSHREACSPPNHQEH